jgi:hypothetical protein
MYIYIYLFRYIRVPGYAYQALHRIVSTALPQVSDHEVRKKHSQIIVVIIRLEIDIPIGYCAL